jgi:8-oxo-dGTP pyrophosphatase MutT (NUDIX family)
MANARQVAVIPVRRGDDGLEVCLIRRKDAEKWGIPKGFVERGDSPEEAALNEANEEAGLKGEVQGTAIGEYEYKKRETSLTVALYVMRVSKEQKEWQEMKFRERQWFSLDAAGAKLSNHPVWPLWDRVRERLAGGFE